MNNRRGRGSGRGEDEVERLLESAQDEVLLKMSVDSHMSRVSPDYLLPDLNRRFQALKSNSSSSKTPTGPLKTTQQQQKKIIEEDDDLMARFAGLKASNAEFHPNRLHEDEGEGEDEVEKIIRWAKDAARLDPSPPSDDDEDDHFDSDPSESDGDQDDERKKKC